MTPFSDVPRKFKTDTSPWLLRVKSISDPLTLGIWPMRNLWPWGIVPALYILLIGQIPMVIGSVLSSQQKWGNVLAFLNTKQLRQRVPLEKLKHFHLIVRLDDFDIKWIYFSSIPCSLKLRWTSTKNYLYWWISNDC